jgi:hypothetical protein
MRVNDGRAIPAFMSQGFAEDVTVFGEEARRAFVIDDLITVLPGSCRRLPSR